MIFARPGSWLPSLLFVAITVPYLAVPGIQYDEILFGNAALGALDDSFVRSDFFGVPVLLMAYIGALKAYLYYPIFSLFGVSPVIIRLPMILLMAFGVRFAFASFRELGVKHALALSLLFALQPSVAMFVRCDVGPSSIELFLKLFVLFVLAKSYRKQSSKGLLLVSLLCLLGVFNKLNFIWFVNALFGAAVLILSYPAARTLATSGRVGKIPFRMVGLIGAAYLPSFIYFMVVDSVFGISSSFSVALFRDSLGVKIHRLHDVITGASFSRYALWVEVGFFNKLYVGLVFSTIAAGCVCLFRNRERLRFFRKPYVFLGLVLVLTVAQILYTNEAKMPWHALAIEPIWMLLVGVSIGCIRLGLRDLAKPWIASLFMVAVVGSLALHSVATLALYGRAYRADAGEKIWSTAIYDLIDYTGDSDGLFYSADWGFHTQLLAFHRDPAKFRDLLAVFERGTEEEKRDYFENVIMSEDRLPVYFLFQSEEGAIFPHIKTELLSLLDGRGLSLQLHEQFRDKRGRLQYEVFRLSRHLP